MNRLLHFESLTEAEANFFGSLDQYFFVEVTDKKIHELSPMQCIHRDEGWYYNFLDKFILIDDSGKPSYIPKLSTKNRDVTYQEMEAMLYAIENDCTYGLYKDGVFSFCGSNVRIVKESGEFIELSKVRNLKTIGLVGLITLFGLGMLVGWLIWG